MDMQYDVIVVGGGPAGYTAALYSARAGLSTLLIEKMAAGGQMTQTMQIDNYPGFPDGIDGFTLGMQMKAGAERFGAQTVQTQVTQLQLEADVKQVATLKGTFFGRVVILAAGAVHKHLGLPQEEALVGRGVAYCAACDGMFYRGKTVAVVGGGNSAAADALLLARVAKKVILIHRRDQLRASQVYFDQLSQTPNVEFRWNSTVKAFLAEEKLTGLVLQNTQTGEESTVEADGVFISIGTAPVSQLVSGQLPLDADGYILADETTRTPIPGVFAIGDVRAKAVRQIVTATADGAVSVHYAQQYLTQQSSIV